MPPFAAVNDVFLSEQQRRPSYVSFKQTSPAVSPTTSDPDSTHFTTSGEDTMGVLDQHPDNSQQVAAIASSAQSKDTAEHDDGGEMPTVGGQANSLKSKLVRNKSLAEACNDGEVNFGDFYDESDPEPSPSPDPPVKATTQRRRRTAETPDEDPAEPKAKKRLRERTDKQLQPYNTDKLKYKAQVKLSNANSFEIEEEMQRNTQQAKKGARKTRGLSKKTVKSAPRSKRARGRKMSEDRISTNSDRSDSEIPDSLDGSTLDFAASTLTSEEKFERTTLFTALDEDPETKAPVKLSKCNTLEKLLASVEAKWATHSGKDLDSIRCSLPWKSQNKVILLRDGLEDSFEQLLEEVVDAPAWKRKESKLEIELLVKLFNA